MIPPTESCLVPFIEKRTEGSLGPMKCGAITSLLLEEQSSRTKLEKCPYTCAPTLFRGRKR
jgi:hypothetical protein